MITITSPGQNSNWYEAVMSIGTVLHEELIKASFTPNYSKGKGELMVVFAGEGSTAARVEYESTPEFEL
eukprot:2509563-Pyramimonas_sp.AAC.1